MPLVLDRKRHDGTRLLVWRINESEETLFSLLSSRFHNIYFSRLQCLKSAKRRLEWVASRVILHTVAGVESPLEYDEYGAPAFSGTDYKVSISHGGGFVFVVLSENSIGIDVQQYSDKLFNVSNAFLNASERMMLSLCSEMNGVSENEAGFSSQKQEIRSKDEYTRRKLLLVWSAKEAVYKLCGIHNLNLKENVVVKTDGVHGFGYTTASVSPDSGRSIVVPYERVGVRYFFVGNIIFVVAEGEDAPSVHPDKS